MCLQCGTALDGPFASGLTSQAAPHVESDQHWYQFSSWIIWRAINQTISGTHRIELNSTNCTSLVLFCILYFFLLAMWLAWFPVSHRRSVHWVDQSTSINDSMWLLFMRERLLPMLRARYPSDCDQASDSVSTLQLDLDESSYTLFRKHPWHS